LDRSCKLVAVYRRMTSWNPASAELENLVRGHRNELAVAWRIAIELVCLARLSHDSSGVPTCVAT
jgi:hypothetical protein